MIALYLLAAHMVGDFVLQTRWQASRKFDDATARTRHVVVYCLPFVPIAFYAATPDTAVFFLFSLYLVHFATDTRRVRSTLGDWLAWRLALTPAQKADDLEEQQIDRLRLGDYHSPETVGQLRPSPERAARATLPANPWQPVGVLVDQTLHLCQLALLGGLLLR